MFITPILLASILHILAFSQAQCILNGECGGLDKFGDPLPCITEIEPTPLLTDDAVNKLTQICGPQLAKKAVCCSDSQVQQLYSKMQRIAPLIESCPACHQNFRSTFCEFTCSPNQHEFVNVVSTQLSYTNEKVPKEVDFYLNRTSAQEVYDSCKDVKFSAMNGRAMDLIGGGARNYEGFFNFLGEPRPMMGGSLFKINFFPLRDPQDPEGARQPNPREPGGPEGPEGPEGSEGAKVPNSKGPKPNDPIDLQSNDPELHSNEPQNEKHYLTLDTHKCYTGSLKCSCVDCEKACPQIGNDPSPPFCKIGPFKCKHLAIASCYTIILLLCLTVYLKSRKSQREQSAIELQRLIQGDEDEEEIPLNLNPYMINKMLTLWFRKQAFFCVKNPAIVVLIGLLIILCSCLGLSGLKFESDPVKLWVSPTSDAALRKNFYDEHFNGFYRTEQLFIVNETGPILQSYDTLVWLKSVEDRIRDLESQSLSNKLGDFCYNPVDGASVSGDNYRTTNAGTNRALYRDDDNTRENTVDDTENDIAYSNVDGCIVESITGYNIPKQNWQNNLRKCLTNPVLCLPTFQQPIDPNIILGESNEYMNTNTLITTFVVRNSAYDEEYLYRVTQWEHTLEQFLLNTIEFEAKERNLRLSFNTESSLERELSRSGKLDIRIICLSYLVMFLYITFSLKENFLLGIFGVLIVLSSILTAAGILGYMDFSLSLIVTEVIPFLALAVGVDNIFLLVHQFHLVQETQTSLVSIDSQIAHAVGSLAPSILLSTCCQVAALLVGCTVDMPAVKSFAIFALLTIILNFFFQLTVYLSIFKLFPPQPPLSINYDYDLKGLDFFISTIYAPFVLGRKTRALIVFMFVLMVSVSLIFVQQLNLGLEPQLSVPKLSFLVQYFKDMESEMRVGPPLYMVLNETGVETRGMQQKLCSRFTTCQTNSLVNLLDAETRSGTNADADAHASTVRSGSMLSPIPPNSFIDDFFMYMNPELTHCCIENSTTCLPNNSWNFNMTGFPENYEFTHYFTKWINDQPTKLCPLAGRASYSDAVSLTPNGQIKATTFRVQHSKLQSQQDFINAYTSGLEIAQKISNELDINVFPYSKFHPFFAQYLHITSTSLKLIAFCLLAIFLVCLVMLGSLRTSLTLSLTLTSLVVNIGGMMKLANISLNALSLVNLLICVGLGLEFCVHLTKQFTFVPQTPSFGLRGHSKLNRTYNSLIGVGKIVLTGVITTKFLGIMMLVWTQSQVFKIFYFRMWLILIFQASLHCFLLLPALLSSIGGGAYLSEGEDNEHTGLNDI